ncbi:hypothetical protein, partial [Pseudochrobactrum kiredjianiae]
QNCAHDLGTLGERWHVSSAGQHDECIKQGSRSSGCSSRIIWQGAKRDEPTGQNPDIDQTVCRNAFLSTQI